MAGLKSANRHEKQGSKLYGTIYYMRRNYAKMGALLLICAGLSLSTVHPLAEEQIAPDDPEMPDNTAVIIPVVNAYETPDQEEYTPPNEADSMDEIFFDESEMEELKSRYDNIAVYSADETLDVPIVNLYNTVSMQEMTGIVGVSESDVQYDITFPFKPSLFRRLESGFGFRSIFGGVSFHTGIDITSWDGTNTEITSVEDGTVIATYDGCANGEFLTTGSSAGLSPGCAYGGNFVRVLSDYQVDQTTTVPVVFTYLHMSPYTLTVNVGDEIKAGDTLGKMGNSGISLGTHLHFSSSVLPHNIYLLENAVGRSLNSGVSDVFESKYTYVDPTIFLDWR